MKSSSYGRGGQPKIAGGKFYCYLTRETGEKIDRRGGGQKWPKIGWRQSLTPAYR